MRPAFIFTAAACLCLGAFAQPSPSEDESLRQALADSNNSPQGYTRELESFLAKFPDAKRRTEVESVLFRSALNMKDLDRIVLYGEKLLQREPDNVVPLENVILAELKSGKEGLQRRALDHARHLERLFVEKPERQATGPEEARRVMENQRGSARSLIYQARATGLLGKPSDAIPFAEKSFNIFPTAEAAREAAHWLSEEGKYGDAARYLSDAFIMPDTKASDDDRAADRLKLAEAYHKWKQTDAGMGDLILSEYDRTSALLAEQRLALKKVDPNIQAADPLEFTLTALEGAPLKLPTLHGKIIVMDFWATWCGPCRVQHPLYEQVKAKFQSHPEVVFLAVNADEDHTAVAPFLKSLGWSRDTYFEDGLGALLRVNSLPTTLIFDASGKLMDRMVGFLPDRFAEQLTKQITAALAAREHAHAGA
jgi:thiol-disulfide isomerase/thioredoxin